jgi:class 3 adenylate cyclase
MTETQRKLCVLFADVCGSTRLYEKLGDSEALHAVDRCITRMERATAIYEGRVVKTIGDEVMAIFPSADAAFQAACEMQQRIDALPPVSGLKLTIRVGFHYGSALEGNNDVFGDTVNVAARMVGLAKGGQITTTGETVEQLSALLRQATRELDTLAVKGKSEGVQVFEIIWQESAELTMRVAPAAAHPARLQLRHAGIEVQVESEREGLSFGRDAGNDFIIADRRASRSHARIERRIDRYVLIDQSTNGTYVTFDGELEFALKHEEVMLRGQGRIAFGHSSRDSNAEVVEFQVS